MSTQDAIAIATFAIALLGVVYSFGIMAERLATTKEDLNGLGVKANNTDIRVSKLGNFVTRLDQRVANLQEEILGEERTERLRESDPDKSYFSPNSGIDL